MHREERSAEQCEVFRALKHGVLGADDRLVENVLNRIGTGEQGDHAGSFGSLLGVFAESVLATTLVSTRSSRTATRRKEKSRGRASS